MRDIVFPNQTNLKLFNMLRRFQIQDEFSQMLKDICRDTGVSFPTAEEKLVEMSSIVLELCLSAIHHTTCIAVKENRVHDLLHSIENGYWMAEALFPIGYLTDMKNELRRIGQVNLFLKQEEGDESADMRLSSTVSRYLSYWHSRNLSEVNAVLVELLVMFTSYPIQKEAYVYKFYIDNYRRPHALYN